MQRRELRLLFFYNGIFVLAGNLLGPLYGLFAEKLQGNITMVSFSWIVLIASNTLCSFLLTGIFGRVKDKELMLLAGYLVRAAAWTGFIFVGSIEGLLAMQALLGLGEALGSPAFDAIFAEKMNPDDRIGEYARWRLVCNVATVIGISLGGVIVGSAGFPLLFALMAMLAMACFTGMFLSKYRITLPAPIPYVLEYVPEYMSEERED